MTQINTIHENAVHPTRQRRGVSSADGFQDSLDIALARKPGCKPEGEHMTPLSEPQSTSINQLAASSAADVVCQADNLLGLLESYANGLGNPKTTMKELASLADRIKDVADKLMVSVDNSGSVGSNLKQIATQTALTAINEHIKFQRGDYL